ncbi:MAG: phosphoribosyl-ATP diphosphatase [Nitrospirota bacterium]|nr:MAG: phosphoribosyl-ATP diphosphatase [Nitrospirota bacterium]
MEKKIVDKLFDLIKDRKNNPVPGSYTCSLFEKGKEEILSKVEEEALEVIHASREETAERLIAELADLYYHILVLMAEEGISLKDIEEELKVRSEANK